jgi:hypothetical protein
MQIENKQKSSIFDTENKPDENKVHTGSGRRDSLTKIRSGSI